MLPKDEKGVVVNREKMGGGAQFGRPHDLKKAQHEKTKSNLSAEAFSKEMATLKMRRDKP